MARVSTDFIFSGYGYSIIRFERLLLSVFISQIRVIRVLFFNDRVVVE